MRNRLALALLVTAGALAAVAGPAGAATIVGYEHTSGPTAGLASGATFVQKGGDQGLFAAPSGGVLTSVALRYLSSDDTIIRFKVLRAGKVRATTDLPAPPAAPGSATRTWQVRVPVEAGDVIAVGSSRASVVAHVDASFGDVHAQPGDLVPPQTFADDPDPYDDVRLILAASLEPDADSDGYGDETQDGCPGLASRQDTPCSVDLASSTRFLPGSVPSGAAGLLQVDVTSPGHEVEGASVSVDVPDGAEVISAAGPGGECAAGDPLLCPVGRIETGETRRIGVVLRLRDRGQATASARTLAAPDANPANDASSATVEVTPVPIIIASPPPPRVDLCTVPRLKGLSRAAARRRLTAAKCALGLVRGARGGRVSTQAIPRGTRVVAGTKVDVRLAARRRAARRRG
jgi:hypothetical protein